MTIRQRVKTEANYLKGLGAIYQAIGRMVKKRPMALIRATPQESAELERAISHIRERYGLSGSEAERAANTAKRRIKRDLK